MTGENNLKDDKTIWTHNLTWDILISLSVNDY